VSLDFSVNINPLGMPDGVQEAILNDINGYETYPDIRYTELREAVAGKERVQAERILCGNGASELIMAVVRAVRPDKCAVAAPSFSGYERAVSAYGAETEYYKLDEKNGFGYADACSQLKDMDIQMCFICNPNNPTGNELNDLEFFIENFSGIVVLDEAYIEFSSRKSAISWLEKYPNLIVLQTLSKAYGMAGLRIGIGAASKEIATLMNTIKGPYNVNSLSQKIALKQLNDEKVFKENLEQILAERELLKAQLNQLDFVKKIYPTEANFFLIKIENPIEIYEFLLILMRVKLLLQKEYYSIQV
jgi:histidinol-phosphate aminotransferase